jgi:hypothetical protein
VDLAENTLFKISGVVTVGELSMDKRDSNSFFSLQLEGYVQLAI